MSLIFFREPSLDKNCIVFAVPDNNAVQDMPLEWKTYDCSLIGDAKPICQYSSSNIDFNLEEPQGILCSFRKSVILQSSQKIDIYKINLENKVNDLG